MQEAEASAVTPPKERAHSGAFSAAAASARDRLRGLRGCALRAHARHCDDAGGRALSLLRTVARCSADRSATIFGAERVRMRLGSWRRGRTILRSCDTPPRDRCLCVRFSVQCSAVHAYLPACGGGDTCRRPRHRLYHRRRNARTAALAALNVNPPGSCCSPACVLVASECA